MEIENPGPIETWGNVSWDAARQVYVFANLPTKPNMRGEHYNALRERVAELETENAAMRKVVEAADDLIIGRLDMGTYYEVSMEDMTALDDAIDALKTGKETTE